MHYSNFKIVLVLLISYCSLSATASPIVIKKYKRPSKALLNRKIIYMDMGDAPQSSQNTNNSKGINNLSSPLSKVKSSPISPRKRHPVKPLSKKAFQVNKLSKKTKLSSIGKGMQKRFNRKTSNSSNQEASTMGEYDEDDWGEYTEYREVELEESLGVQAKILK